MLAMADCVVSNVGLMRIISSIFRDTLRLSIDRRDVHDCSLEAAYLFQEFLLHPFVFG